MDSHQVEGQRRCACATRRVLPPVKLAAPRVGGQLPGDSSDSRSRPSAGIPDRPVPGTPIGACTDCDAVAAQLGQRLPALQAVIDDLGVGRPVGHELPLCHQPLVSAAATLRDFGCRNRRRWSALARVISSSILKQTWKCLNARSPTLLPRHETGGGGGIAAPRTLA